MNNNVKGSLLAGYYIAYPGTYFNKVLIISELAQHPDIKVAAVRDRWMQELKESGGQFVNQIGEAVKIANHFEVGAPPMPKFPNEYFDWAGGIYKAFKAKLLHGSSEVLAFDQGFHLANIASNCNIIKACLHLQLETNGVIEKTELINHLIIDSLNSDLLLGGGAILLSRSLNNGKIHEDWKLMSDKLKVNLSGFLPKMENEQIKEFIEKTDQVFVLANHCIKSMAGV